MKKTIWIGTALLLIALVAAPAFAKQIGWSGPGSTDDHTTKRVEQLRLLLDLTPEQEEQIREIIDARQEESKQNREDIRSIHQEVRELMAASDLNEPRLRKLLHEEAEIKADRAIRRHATRAAINKILTPEQQEKNRALRDLKHHRKGKHIRAATNEHFQEM